jgi:hypothetical protein
MHASAPRRILASLLVTAIALVIPAARAQALDASLSGRVFEADGVTPRAGVTVNLVLGEGESIFASPTTNADGIFAIASAPPGSYRVVVETSAGAFLAPQPLELEPGVNRPVALSLATEQSGLGSATADPIAEWLKWLIIGLIGVAGLYVIFEVTDSEDSPSTFVF